MKKCLMIKTKNQNKFFTHEKNLPQLIEFSKIFRAEVSIVQIPETTEILTLDQLAPALCEKTQQKSSYQIVRVINKKQKRQNIIKRANLIQKTIKNLLSKTGTVSLKDISNKFKKYNLTSACICNHFKTARKALECQGFKVIKTGFGEYKLKS